MGWNLYHLARYASSLRSLALLARGLKLSLFIIFAYSENNGKFLIEKFAYITMEKCQSSNMCYFST